MLIIISGTTEHESCTAFLSDIITRNDLKRVQIFFFIYLPAVILCGVLIFRCICVYTDGDAVGILLAWFGSTCSFKVGFHLAAMLHFQRHSFVN